MIAVDNAQPISISEFRSKLEIIYTNPRYAPRTWEKVKRILDLMEAHGAKTTADLNTTFVSKYVTARAQQGIAANTIRGELSYFKSLANFAVEEEWLRKPPRWKRITPRPSPPIRKQLFEIAEIRRVFRHLRASSLSFRGGRLWALAATVGLTGVRLEEALYLKVEDVDLEKRCLNIDPRRRYKTTKSASPVPIPPDLAVILAQWVPRAATVSDWVFPSSTNTPWTSGGVGKKPTSRLKASAWAVGVEDLTFLSLRHTFSTWARREWGLTALQLRDILRHETEETQEHYVHQETRIQELVKAVARVSYW